MKLSWTEIIHEKVRGSIIAVSPLGEPYVTLPLGNRENVDLYFTIDGHSLPFSIWFKRRDELNNILEERLYAQAGTRELATKFMVHVADLRINSLPLLPAQATTKFDADAE